MQMHSLRQVVFYSFEKGNVCMHFVHVDIHTNSILIYLTAKIYTCYGIIRFHMYPRVLFDDIYFFLVFEEIDGLNLH